jgi:hypothetical protein
MARKRNEARSIISEGGTGAVTRRRTSHVKAAQHAEPVQQAEALKSEPTAVDATVQVANGNQSKSFASISEHEEIATLAYFLWEARGRQIGSPEEDWLRAEQEYRRRASTR